MVALNNSPVGTVDSADLDAWKMTLPETGTYSVIVVGTPVSVFVIDGFGEVVATPDDAVMLGENSYSYSAEIGTTSLTVLLLTDSTPAVPYYWYAVKA